MASHSEDSTSLKRARTDTSVSVKLETSSSLESQPLREVLSLVRPELGVKLAAFNSNGPVANVPEVSATSAVEALAVQAYTDPLVHYELELLRVSHNALLERLMELESDPEVAKKKISDEVAVAQAEKAAADAREEVLRMENATLLKQLEDANAMITLLKTEVETSYAANSRLEAEAARLYSQLLLSHSTSSAPSQSSNLPHHDDDDDLSPPPMDD